jgi:hypothetical protein
MVSNIDIKKEFDLGKGQLFNMLFGSQLRIKNQICNFQRLVRAAKEVRNFHTIFSFSSISPKDLKKLNLPFLN